MFCLVVISIALGLMTLSEKAWGNPLSILGLGYIAFCFTMLISLVLKTVGITLG